ncbi:polysaccharide deacetylase family protein [Natrinema halophilum]|uniref:Polysaccharide deacetylase family protein n=1 Tax=Natrinema halophilum TaxID=1699371 RepID=A0A7D5GHL5_9EURY|nr:polysaccharide deacetylase family protein [Natrinema halophilum]QLG49228.1 polysaccharide deacetylase family protein [Natrinema halophilum]
MHRRTYLAAAATLPLAGCAGSETSSPSSAADPANDAGNGDGEPESATPSDRSTDDPELAGTVDDFEDLTTWDILGGALSPASDRAVVGTQSGRLEIPAAEPNGGLARRFSNPIDCSDVVPGVAVASDALVVPVVRLVDVDGNRVDYRRAIKADLPLARYNFGVKEIAGGFDPTAVEEVQLLVWTGEGASGSVWFDDLHFVPRPERGKVMFQFDDAHVTDYTEALPILEEYDYPAVSFVTTGYVDEGDVGGDTRLSTDQIHELHDAGWCIANHTVSHEDLPELTPKAQAAEIRGGKEWLIDRGLEAGADYFAYPFGAYDASTLEIVANHHDIAFAGGMPAQGYLSNTAQASRFGEPSVERARTAIERTASMRGITSLLFHRLEGERIADFEAIVETIREYESAGAIDVILPADLEREYRYQGH